MHTPAQTHTRSQLVSDTPLFLAQAVLETPVSARNTHTVSSGTWPQTHYERLCFLRYFPFEKWEKGVLWRHKRRWDKGTRGPTAFLPCSPQFSPACPWCNWGPIKQRPRPAFHWAVLPCFYRDLDASPGLSTRRGLPTRWVSDCVRESHSVMSNCMVHGIFQARILEWVAFPFSRGSSQPRDRTQVSCITGGFFASWAVREASHKVVVSNSIPPRALQGFYWRRQWGNWERERWRDRVRQGRHVSIGGCACSRRARISTPQEEQISFSILVWGYTKEFAQRAPFFTNIQKLKTTKLAWEQLYLAYLSPSWTSEAMEMKL